MEHFNFTPTPITRLNYFSEKFGIDLWAKRDDLFPSALGGSKARMLQYILFPILKSGKKTIVTAGGPCSNFNRSIALLCAQYGLQLKLVSYTDNPVEYKTALNNYLVGLTNCEYIYCDKSQVPETIKQVMDNSDKDTTTFIWGGGKSLQGVYSYYDAVRELKKQKEEIDELFVACGTGTTLTGICAGMQEYYPHAKVHGISVARTFDSEKAVLQEDMAYLNEYMNSHYDFSNLIFHEEFLLGGYGKSSDEELNVIKECISHEGMVVDPTYVGKAFYGMNSILSHKNCESKKMLFWNTGGVINLLSEREQFSL